MPRMLGLVGVLMVMTTLVLLIEPAAAQDAPRRPASTPCAPGASYDPACDVDHDGDVDVFDVQLAAGHWGQTGPWSSGSWDLTGNAGTTAGTHFLGTVDLEALELRVAGQRVLRLEPVPAPPDGAPAGGASTPNVIGGHADNAVTTYVQGAAIGGGGSAGQGHQVLDDFGVIGGGYHNRAGDGAGTSSDRAHATVSGGADNWASGSGATVGGGTWNAAHATNATVAGGTYNLANAGWATVGGGYLNHATSNNATVAGGAGNTAIGSGATVGGGGSNTASGSSATVGGGNLNQASLGYATVGGGFSNTASGAAAAVGGGEGNTASSSHAVVAGGSGNQAASIYAAVVGGFSNMANGSNSAVGGGNNNTASGYSATVGGGFDNLASGDYATVSGGYDNAASGDYSFAAGRRAKANHAGAFVWADSASTDFASTATSQFLVRAAGGVGINTNAPNAALAVDGGNSVTRIAVNSNSPTANAGFLMRQDGVSRWSIATILSDGDLTFFREGVGGGIRLLIDGGGTNAGYVGIGNNAPQYPLHMASGAYVTTGGVWTNASSRALKVDFAAVDRAALLETLATLPIATWSYRAEGSGVRHLGPTAEDFYAAFGLGDGDAAIGTVDADGVTLAAVQALYELAQAQQAELAAQQAHIDSLEARLTAAPPAGQTGSVPWSLGLAIALAAGLAWGLRRAPAGWFHIYRISSRRAVKFISRQMASLLPD